jgi:hypothetical protein
LHELTFSAVVVWTSSGNPVDTFVLEDEDLPWRPAKYLHARQLLSCAPPAYPACKKAAELAYLAISGAELEHARGRSTKLGVRRSKAVPGKSEAKLKKK